MTLITTIKARHRSVPIVALKPGPSPQPPPKIERKITDRRGEVPRKPVSQAPVAPAKQDKEEKAEFPRKLAFLFQPKRYKVAYGGRGGAKSWNFARALLILGAQKPLRILCAREYQNSIAESVHKLIGDQVNLLKFDGQEGRPLYVIEKASIYNPQTGTEFSFEGIRNNISRIRSYEGIDVCWVEEANKVSKSSWEILIPTIRKAGSEIWISFNPELEEDDTYQRFVKNKYGIADENLICVKISWKDNPWFPKELEEERQALYRTDMDAYLNVWEGNPRVVLDGAVYATELRDLRKDGRITSVPYDPSSGVDVFLDLGYADATSIWFAQTVGFQYRIIDFYQNQLKGFDHYLQVLQGRGYVYRTMWLPHDAKAKTLGTQKSIEEQARAVGYKVRIVPRLSLWDGINAARLIFPNCYFDEKKCSEGIQNLSHYRFEISEDGHGTMGKQPIHDENSHAADAFRYMGISLKFPKGEDDFLTRGAQSLSKKWADRVPSALGWMTQ